MKILKYRFWTMLLLLLCIPALAKNSTQSPSEFLKGMEKHDGFVPFYIDQTKGKVFLLINHFDQEMLYLSSLPQGLGSNDIGLDRGQLTGSRLVRFEHVGDKVLLRQINTRYRADSDNTFEHHAIEEAFANSVLWGFPVTAQDKRAVVVDASAFLIRDSHGVIRQLSEKKQGKYKIDKSRSALYKPRSKAFPKNTELEATVTFVGDNPGDYLKQVAPDPYSVSLRLHHSFVALPEPGFITREYHPESGFFSFDYFDYASGIEQPIHKRLIPRHRLKKKHPEKSVSEAENPIVYYLDRGTPEPVRSALLDGARWWNTAFEAIGYKNAFQVKILPADADPMDVRYNVIQWVHRATRGWSYGSMITDPRNGEIIKGHVTLGSLRVRQDYLIAQGMTSPFDNSDTNSTNEVSKKLLAMALARIRQLSAHEVGHTLGIAHNFAASVNQRSSVMDYPHPQIHLDTAGNISLEQAYASGIGEWDKRALAYGYADFDSSNQEKEALQKHVNETRELGLLYISDPDSRAIGNMHPNGHLWDNGIDAVQELERLIALRKTALSNFDASAIPFGATYSSLEEVLVPVYYYHRFQIEAVGKWLGGANYYYATRQANEDVLLQPVTASNQQRALNSLLTTLSPDFLVLPKKIRQLIPPKPFGFKRTRESSTGYTGVLMDPVSLAEASLQASLDILLHPQRLARMRIHHADNEKQPSVQLLLSRLRGLIEKEEEGLKREIHQRLIASIVQQWLHLLSDEKSSPEIRADVFYALENLKVWLKKQSKRSSTKPSYKALYVWQSHLIERAASFQNLTIKSVPMHMPPGSPI